MSVAPVEDADRVVTIVTFVTFVVMTVFVLLTQLFSNSAMIAGATSNKSPTMP